MATLITGASRGLGFELTKAYIARDITVIGCSRSGADIEAPNFIDYKADVANEHEVKTMFKELSKSKVEIDTIIHSAGLSQSSLAIMTSADKASDIIDVNFLGTFLVTREGIKKMMQTGYGRIISISSVNVPLHSPGGSIYNSTKAAIENLMQTLTSEYGHMDITFNSLGLSIVKDSGMAKGLSDKAAQEKRDKLGKPVDLEISEVVHAIDFLSDSRAAKVSGQTIYMGAP